MNDFDPETGLCRGCAHVREVVSARGAVFFMCKHPERPKYPPLPVMSCDAHVRKEEAHVVVPYERLSADALRGVIDEFVSREGTEHGLEDVELEDKRASVVRQLKKGVAVVLFDRTAGTANIVLARDLP